MKIDLSGATKIPIINEIERSVCARYAGFRVIGTPISRPELYAAQMMAARMNNCNMVTIDQVETFAQNKAKELGYTGKVKIKWEEESANG